MTIICGECLEEMRKMEDNSISAIVTDPPYGLSFMGKGWDHVVPGKEYWSECLRISKPGAFLLAMGGTRTFHRLACAIEDVGYEIRDCISWLYGSGFPKNHDISKAIDKCGGNPGLIDEISNEIKRARQDRQLSIKECDDKFCNSSTNWSWFEGRPAGKHLPSDLVFSRICDEWPELLKYFEKVKDLNREIIPTTGNLHKGSGNTVGCFTGNQRSNIPLSNLAEIFSGYGTALKPAYEPIIMAMKPLDGTFKQNAEKWGQAGINIDACRVGEEGGTCKGTYPNEDSRGIYGKGLNGTCEIKSLNKGRWPANVIFDEEAAKLLDDPSGVLKSGSGERRPNGGGTFFKGVKQYPANFEASTGGASRFFYCAKASSSERGEGNNHPTVKPLKLMEYLIKLIMPPKDGVLLDPFAGSGTTILAAHRLGLKAIGIEKEPEYAEIAKTRMENFNHAAGQ